MNLDEFKSTVTGWLALHVNGNNESPSQNVIYFDSFGDEHIPKEKTHRNTLTNICRMQAYELIKI